MQLIYITTYWAVFVGLAVSLFFFAYFDPANDKCMEETVNYQDYSTTSESVKIVILVPFLVWTLIFHGSFSRIFGGKKPDQDPKGKLKFQADLIWDNFFDRWTIVGFASITYIVIGPVNNEEHAKLYDAMETVISYAFTTWATGNLFSDICVLLEGSNEEVKKLHDGNKTFQLICQTFSFFICIALILGVTLGDDKDSKTQDAIIAVFLLIRAGVEIYSISTFTSLIKTLQRHNYQLINAIATGSQPSDINSATQSPLQGNLKSKNENSEKLRSYSDVYYDLSRIFDLLRMATTVMFIIATAIFMLLLVLFYPHQYGNHFIEFFLKTVSVVLPFLYLLVYRRTRTWGTKLTAIAKARSFCIFMLYGLLCVMMAATGVNRGCNWLLTYKDDINRDNKVIVFIAYFIKSMALQTTVSFGLVFLSSPGVRGFLMLPVFLQNLLVPSIWPSPFTVQQIHEASGANFLLCGSIHGFIWIIVLGAGLVTLKTKGYVGVSIAIVSGITMVISGVKLLWPPGYPMPYVNGQSWQIIKRLDVFLRDSKYGSWHVYLALLTFVMYCLHKSFIVPFYYSPYFIFVAFSYVILRLAHPATRAFVDFLFAQKALTYQLLSIKTTPVRGRSTFNVTLKVKPPQHYDMSIFKNSCCDIILLRNITDSNLSWLETVHYFSVVGIYPKPDDKPEYIDVVMFIQKTRRPDGITTQMIDTGMKKTDPNIQITEFPIRMSGLVKSNCLETIFLPSLIAFGFESGAAAFCSLFRQRMRMKDHIATFSPAQLTNDVEDGVMKTRVSELNDVCVVWFSFMSRPKGELQAEHLVTALKDIIKLQDFLYENAGGHGNKYIFVGTGVPPEWTPNPECIAHKTRGLEEDVAKLLDISIDLVAQGEWEATEAIVEASRSEQTYDPTVEELKTLEDEIDGAAFTSRLTFAPTTKAGGAESRMTFASASGDESMSARPTFSKKAALSEIKHHFPATKQPSVKSEKKEEAAKSEKKPGDISPEMKEKLKFLLQVQAREESWVPLRHACGSSWREFKRILDFRVRSTIQWLNSEGGPDYTCLFITEHASDIGVLKDFKYVETYNEVNRQIIENEIKYCKNPGEYMANKFHKDGDPVHVLSETAAAVLYSGDFQSAKKDQLLGVVENVREAQRKKRMNCSITFVPDA